MVRNRTARRKPAVGPGNGELTLHRSVDRRIRSVDRRIEEASKNEIPVAASVLIC